MNGKRIRSDCIGDLKKQIFKVTKLLNVIRKQNAEVKDASDFQKQIKSFRENPQKFAKKLFDNKQYPAPNFDAQKAQNFFKKTFSNNIRGMTHEHPPNLKRPSYLFCPFKTNPPTKEEISVALKGKRNVILNLK